MTTLSLPGAPSGNGEVTIENFDFTPPGCGTSARPEGLVAYSKTLGATCRGVTPPLRPSSALTLQTGRSQTGSAGDALRATLRQAEQWRRT